MSTKILNTQVMELDKALSSYRDTHGEIVSFTIDPNNSDIYTGTGSDGKTYYVQVEKPTMCIVRTVINY
jgi:hypothetical protein